MCVNLREYPSSPKKEKGGFGEHPVPLWGTLIVQTDLRITAGTVAGKQAGRT